MKIKVGIPLMRIRIWHAALSGRSNSSAQAGEKGSGIGRLTANSSLSGPQGPGTFVRQNAVMVSKGAAGNPAVPSSTATAPCTGPPTSLFRQFAPELLLPSVGLPRSPASVPSGPTDGPEAAVYRGICVFRSSDWTGRNDKSEFTSYAFVFFMLTKICDNRNCGAKNDDDK